MKRPSDRMIRRKSQDTLKVCVALPKNLVTNIHVIAAGKGQTFRDTVAESLAKTVDNNQSYIPEALRSVASISN